MTFKSVKTIAAASFIALATGTTAFAAGMSHSTIFPGAAQDTRSVVSLELVRADQAGTVSVYDFSKGTQGELLGSEAVRAGVNSNVKIQLDNNSASETLVVLSSDGMTPAATAKITDFDS